MLKKQPASISVLDSNASRGPIRIPSASVSTATSSRNVLRVLYLHRMTLLVCLLLSLASAMFYLGTATRMFRCSSQIFVQQSGPRIINEALTTTANSAGYILAQSRLIRSTAILSSAIESSDIKRIKALMSSGNPVAYLKAALDVEVSKQGDIITVSAESPNLEEAALIVNKVVEAYIDYQERQQRSIAGEVLKVLQNEKEKREPELQATYQAMMQFRKTNGTLSFAGDKGNIVTQRQAQLSDALTTTQIEEFHAKALVEVANSVRDDPGKLQELIATQRANGESVPWASDSSELRTEYYRLKLYKSALPGYGSNHPALQRVDDQLRTIEKALDKLDQAAAEVFHQQLIKAQKREEVLTKALKEQEQLVSDLNVKAAEYSQMQSQAQRTEKLLDLLDGRIKELNVTEKAGALNISVLEPAREDAFSVRPNKSRTLGLALLVGLMVGTAGSLLQDWLDQRLHSTEEIAEVLDLPLLGIVPHIALGQTIRERGKDVDQHPRSLAAEAYRTIRTAIHFGVIDSDWKSLLVASPDAGEGKTTTASNLAIAFAQSNCRVVLVDADCREPVLHRIFELGNEKGLSDVLMGKKTLNEVLKPSGIAGLDILPCGTVPENPAELLNSAAFVELINKLASRYDRVIIDSPPIVPLADARIVAASCDATVLVLRAEQTTRRTCQHTKDILASVGANVLGMVVNDVSPKSRSYGDYQAYRYRHIEGNERLIRGQDSIQGA
jgi:succinoglycan biosynthesis transport protein ExoP